MASGAGELLLQVLVLTAAMCCNLVIFSLTPSLIHRWPKLQPLWSNAGMCK